jgi:hypothetical protein
MPKLGGRPLSERLQAIRPELRTLFLSGYLDEVALPEHDLASPGRFLAKPYDLDVLARRVRELLDQA